MIAYYARRSGGETFEKLSKPVSTGLWLDGNNLSDLELDQIINEYELQRNVVYDVRDWQELPRVEFANDDTYIFTRLPRIAKSGHVATAPILSIVRPSQFLTLSVSDTITPDQLMAEAPSSVNTPPDMMVAMLASMIASYQDLIKHTERSINDTGARLRSHEVTNQDFIHFVTVEDNLMTYVMNLEGLLRVIDRLRNSEHGTFVPAHEELDDMALQIQQLLVAVHSYGGRVESIKSAYSTIANNTLNLRMKTLTVFTVLITVPNVFYGMFGMNVLLPFDGAPWAYAAVVGFTVILTIIVYIVAKHKKIF